MKKPFLTYLVLTLLPLSLISVDASAYDKRGPKHEGKYGDRIAEKLDLSEEQREKLKEIRSGIRAKSKETREKVKSAQKQLQEGFASGAPEAELRKLHQQLQERRAELANIRFESLLSIGQVLTPEQREKFREMKIEGRRGHWGKKHGKNRRGKGKDRS